mmetsp:Transcript_10298/g.26693  ORF Transcript_10298/g.26693 Transcript_10298/m.26693 type:complete len:224 (+) Transcript_10298:1220-1891(+)
MPSRRKAAPMPRTASRCLKRLSSPAAVRADSLRMSTSSTVALLNVPTASRFAARKSHVIRRPPPTISHSMARHAPPGSARHATTAVLKPSPKPPAVPSPPLVESATPVSSARGCSGYVNHCVIVSSSAAASIVHTRVSPHANVSSGAPPAPPAVRVSVSAGCSAPSLNKLRWSIVFCRNSRRGAHRSFHAAIGRIVRPVGTTPSLSFVRSNDRALTAVARPRR